jgi:hypothetical protein
MARISAGFANLGGSTAWMFREHKPSSGTVAVAQAVRLPGSYMQERGIEQRLDRIVLMASTRAWRLTVPSSSSIINCPQMEEFGYLEMVGGAGFHTNH